MNCDVFMSKKYLILWLAIPIAVAIAVIGVATAPDANKHRVKHLVYTDDYPTKYAEELTQIFGDYTLGERMEKHVEGEDCSCGYHQDTLDFYEWQITYTDACGQEMQCTINNYETIFDQQYAWLGSQIEEHVFDKAFFVMVSPADHYLVIRIGNIVSATCGDEQWSHMETADAYKERLLQSRELLTLHSLNYAEIFDRFPITISGGIRLEHQNISGESINVKMTETVLLMEDRINYLCLEIGENLNIQMLVYTNTVDPAVVQKQVRCKYIRGLQVDPQMDICDYSNAIYESYIGKFW